MPDNARQSDNAGQSVNPTLPQSDNVGQAFPMNSPCYYARPHARARVRQSDKPDNRSDNPDNPDKQPDNPTAISDRISR